MMQNSGRQDHISASGNVVSNNTWIVKHPLITGATLLAASLAGVVAWILIANPEVRENMGIISDDDPTGASDADMDSLTADECREIAIEEAEHLFADSPDLVKDAVWVDCLSRDSLVYLTEKDPRRIAMGTCSTQPSECADKLVLDQIHESLLRGCDPDGMSACISDDAPDWARLLVHDLDSDGGVDVGIWISENDAIDALAISSNPENNDTAIHRRYWGAAFLSRDLLFGEEPLASSDLQSLVCTLFDMDSAANVYSERCYRNFKNSVSGHEIENRLNSELPRIEKAIVPGMSILRAWAREQDWYANDRNTRSTPVQVDIRSVYSRTDTWTEDIIDTHEDDGTDSTYFFLYVPTLHVSVNFIVQIDDTRCTDSDHLCNDALIYARIIYGWVGDREFCKNAQDCPELHIRAGDDIYFIEGKHAVSKLSLGSGEVVRHKIFTTTGQLSTILDKRGMRYNVCNNERPPICLDLELLPRIPQLADIPEVLEIANGQVYFDDGVIYWNQSYISEDRVLQVGSGAKMPLRNGRKTQSPAASQWPTGLTATAEPEGFSFKRGPSLGKVCDSGQCTGISIVLDSSHSDALARIEDSTSTERLCSSGVANSLRLARLWLTAPGMKAVRISQHYCLESISEYDEEGEETPSREARTFVGSPKVEVGRKFDFILLDGGEILLWNGEEAHTRGAEAGFQPMALDVDEKEVASRLLAFAFLIDEEGIHGAETDAGALLSRLFSVDVDIQIRKVGEYPALELSSDDSLAGYFAPRNFMAYSSSEWLEY